MPVLKEVIDSYMRKVSWLKEHCDRCLRTERWNGSTVLMVVDAAFTSIGLTISRQSFLRLRSLIRSLLKVKE